MKRVLVTGANGMLGTDVCTALRNAGIEAIATAAHDAPVILDVTNSAQALSVIQEQAPDAVIHCAAYTEVDQAEAQPDVAYHVNYNGSRYIAFACMTANALSRATGTGFPANVMENIPLCAISTDFVFDGTKGEPYVETDVENPISVYGRSKQAGEVAVRETCPLHWIIRTSWLFGLHGKCFPDTILKAAETKRELSVVADQRGTPTYTADLAEAIVRLIQYPVYGTYHVANTADNGYTTWYELARKTLELAGSHTPVRPITTTEWPTPARRPANSALRCGTLEKHGLPLLRPWQDALKEYVDKRKALAQE